MLTAMPFSNHAVQLGLGAVIFFKVMQELLGCAGQVQILGRAMEFFPGFQDFFFGGLFSQSVRTLRPCGHRIPVRAGTGP